MSGYSARQKPAKEKVFVDWPAVGYCKYFMTHSCNYGDRCKFHHPPREEVKPLWEAALSLQEEGKRPEDHLPKPPPKPRGGGRKTGRSGAFGGSPRPHQQYGRESSYQPPQSRQSPRKRILEQNWRQAHGTSVYNGGSLDRHPWDMPTRRPAPAPALMDWTTDELAHSLIESGHVKKKKWDMTTKEEGMPQIVIGEVEKAREMSENPEAQPHFSTSGSLLPISSAHHHPLTTAAMPSPVVVWRRPDAAPIGPHPSTIHVAAQYMSQQAISRKLEAKIPAGADHQERSIAEAREENLRMEGVSWIDRTRRGLQLPIRSYATATVFYHKLRLLHTIMPNNMENACVAALALAVKTEDTQKKSKDILTAAYNLNKSPQEQVGSDDPIFEAPHRAVIGLERLLLEAISFDFRTKEPHKFLTKVAKTLPDDERQNIYNLAYQLMTDLHRTFAPLKQTSSTMAIACLELAIHLKLKDTTDNVSAARDAVQNLDLKKFATTREEIMETLFDLLDLYTLHTQQTNIGTMYSLEEWLRIRVIFNKEATEKSYPRYIHPPARSNDSLRVSNGHPTPVSPMEPGVAATSQPNFPNYPPIPAGGGTQRFMLDLQRAAAERAQVQKYFEEEWEEYSDWEEVTDDEEEAEEPPEEEQHPNTSNRTTETSSSYSRPREFRDDRNRDRGYGGYRGDREADRNRPPGPHDRDHRPHFQGRGGPPPQYDPHRDNRRFDERGRGRYEDRGYGNDRRHERR